MRTFIRNKIGKFLIPRNKLLVFTLHQSTPVFNEQLNGHYIWSSTEQLEHQVRYLKDNFPIVPLYEGLVSLRSGKLKGTVVAITFDDGDYSIAEYVAPMLQNLNIPATFFINTAYLTENKKGYWFNIYNYLKLGTPFQRNLLTNEIVTIAENLRNTNDSDYYQRNCFKIEELAHHIEENVKFYMTIDDIKNLDPELFNIALHGHEHQRFSMMPRDWQKTNLIRNIEILSGMPAYKPIFAFPFGKPHDWNSDTIELCKELKLEIAFSNGGYNTAKSFGIDRIPVDGTYFKKAISSIKLKKWNG